jgi:hypothetical protein
MNSWIMYGRAERSVYGNQWVRIASGEGEYLQRRAQAWWGFAPCWDEIKTEWNKEPLNTPRV